MGVGINYEIWTLPNSGAFKRKADITRWVVARELDARANDLDSGGINVHTSCPYLDAIQTVDPDDHSNDVGSTLMLFRDETWLAAFVVVEREDRATEDQPFVSFLVEGMEWFLDRARVRAFDYPADPIREGDWLYGAPSILPQAGDQLSNEKIEIWRSAGTSSGTFTLTDGTDETAEHVEIWISGATLGDFKLSDGTDTTLAIAYNASAATIETRIETDWASVTDATVSGTGTFADPWVIEVVTPSGFVPVVSVVDNTTDGNISVGQPLRFDATASEIKTALVTHITAINDVAVSGDGSVDFPWAIEVLDPAGTNAVDLSVGTNSTDGNITVSIIRDGGTPSPLPWHGSVDGETGLRVGTYQEFEMVEAGVGGVPAAPAGSTSTHLLKLNPDSLRAAGDYAGAQVEPPVLALNRYRGNVQVISPVSSQQVRLSIRSMTEDMEAWNETTVSTSWVTLTAVDVDGTSFIVFPDGTDTAIYRIGVIEEDNADPIYIDVNGAVLAPGDIAKPYGEIMNDLRAPIVARGVLDWLNPTWTDTLDSSGQAWDQDQAWGIRHGQTVYQVEEFARKWGYEHAIRYNPANPASTPFDWEIYNPGNAGTDYTGLGGPSINPLDGTVDAGASISRAPDATQVIAEGADGRWGESTDAALASGWGILEGYLADNQGRDSTGLASLASSALSTSARGSTGRRIRVQNPVNTPLDVIRLYDTVPVISRTRSGASEVRSMRVVGVTIGHRDEPAAFYDYHLDSMVFEPDAAQADAVRSLIRSFEALENQVAGGGGSFRSLDTPATATAAGVSGAFVHLARAATQSIAVGGEAIAFDRFAALGYAGFGSTPTPSTEIRIPLAGYWNIDVMAGWSSHTAGGTVWITRTRDGVETTVWPPTEDPGIWTATDGALFEGTAHAIPCQVGDILKVYIDHDAGTVQDLAKATASAYLVDRTGDVSGVYQAVVLDDGPIAYWRLDEASGTTAADSTGNGHDMTYVNSPTLGEAGIMRDGSNSPSVLFNGTSQRVEGLDWSTLDLAGGVPFSIEAWFNAAALDANTDIIAEKRVNGGVGWELGAVASGVFFAGDSAAVVSSGALSVDTDYYVAVTYDGTTVRLYLDGVEVDTAAGVTITANTRPVSVGWDSDAAGFLWNGYLDEVAVYGRALSAVEIAEHYSVGTQGA